MTDLVVLALCVVYAGIGKLAIEKLAPIPKDWWEDDEERRKAENSRGRERKKGETRDGGTYKGPNRVS